MRALRIHRHGEPQLDIDVPAPSARGDDAVIDLVYAGLNPVDVFIMQGTIAPDAPLPRVLGIDGSGHLQGRPVLVHGAGVGVTRDGTLAEQVAAPPTAIVPIPDGVSLEAATGCGNAGATAIRLCQLAEPVAGDRALVLAASGSVGGAICSLLSAAGVEVWGQTRREIAAAFVREAGAAPLIAETPEDLAGALAAERLNILFDPLGGKWTSAAIDMLSLDARHVVYGTITGQIIEFNLRKFYRRGGTMRSYRGILEPPERLQEGVALALAALAEGRLRIPVGPHIPLTQAADGYALLSTNRVGRIVIEIAR
ncbi:MAG: zinc-binding alcohol dehydrogenase family protein [Bradyrhizobiaceae bacterium]|nr:zinc-binding alcohol dehydrogenase family protein [Bradyrhizobiaceae bacterium]